jgi:hypothetical protein
LNGTARLDGRAGKPNNSSHAGVAQLVEQLICNQPVGGSNPSASTKYIRDLPAAKSTGSLMSELVP